MFRAAETNSMLPFRISEPPKTLFNERNSRCRHHCGDKSTRDNSFTTLWWAVYVRICLFEKTKKGPRLAHIKKFNDEFCQ